MVPNEFEDRCVTTLPGGLPHVICNQSEAAMQCPQRVIPSTVATDAYPQKLLN